VTQVESTVVNARTQFPRPFGSKEHGRPVQTATNGTFLLEPHNLPVELRQVLWRR